MSELAKKCGCKPFGPNLTNTMDCPIHAPSGTTAEPGVRGTAPIPNQSLPKEQVDELRNGIWPLMPVDRCYGEPEIWCEDCQQALDQIIALTTSYTNKRVVEELSNYQTAISNLEGVVIKVNNTAISRIKQLTDKEDN